MSTYRRCLPRGGGRQMFTFNWCKAVKVLSIWLTCKPKSIPYDLYLPEVSFARKLLKFVLNQIWGSVAKWLLLLNNFTWKHEQPTTRVLTMFEPSKCCVKRVLVDCLVQVNPACCSNGKSLEERLASSKQNIPTKNQDPHSGFMDKRRFVDKCSIMWILF